MHTKANSKLSAKERDALLHTLQIRFEQNMNRHPDVLWQDVYIKLKASAQKMWSLQQMEQSGGEPDVVSKNLQMGEFIFFDCAAESPSWRRSFCYDAEALEARKENKPKNSAVAVATTMDIELLSEEQYLALQKLGSFDVKTSSWLKTPNEIRKQGGAIFGDRRFGRTFIYHNGAESYYAARGFRGWLQV